MVELGHIALYVTNLDQSVEFYSSVIGLKLAAQEHPIAFFSSPTTHHCLTLIEIGIANGHYKELKPGLYHIAFKAGNSLEELKKIKEKLLEQKVTIVGAADHTVTKSLYILDPDVNEVELYVDVSDAWKDDARALLSPAQLLEI